MKNIFFKIVSFFFLLPNIVQAEGVGIQKAFSNVKENFGSQADVNNSDLLTVVASLVQLALSVMGVVFVIFMIYAGFLWLTAAGNDQKVDKSKTILFQSILGLIIVVGAYAITSFVVYIFSEQINLS
ncbi:MAG: hypothetical protein ACOYL8_03305 [Patescibacteria group bacterium]